MELIWIQLIGKRTKYWEVFMAYSKKVVDKFENTINEPAKFNVGRFDPKDMDIGTGMVGAPACGDVMKLQIKCERQGNTHIIKDVKFKTYGCGSAIASSSELVEMLLGKTLEEAKEIKNIDIVEALELPPIKIHCSVLAEDSIKQAIEDYEKKQ
jgi:nitrogen fixation NifU-like protein